jgi:hypothetical protein
MAGASIRRQSLGCGEETETMIEHAVTQAKKGVIDNDHPFRFSGADVGIRTPDLLITNQLLYQLSYIGLLSI